VDRRADGDPQLMGVHHAGEFPAGLLSCRRQRQTIPILCEDDASEVRRALQEEVVVTIGRAVRARRQHVDAPLPHADGNRARHVAFTIESEAHCRPACFSFSRSTEDSRPIPTSSRCRR
jgi:hypothetical protein